MRTRSFFTRTPPKRIASYLAPWLALALAPCLLFTPGALAQGTEHRDVSDRRVLVRFDPELLADANPAETALARVAEAVTDGRVRRGYRIVPGLVSLEVPPGTVDAAIESLARLPGVLYAEHDAKRYPQAVPNDAWYAQQWWAPAVRLPQAWNIRTDASATIVAVLDTGVNYHHPELAPNMWTNMVEANGLTGVDDDGNGYIDDLHGIGVDVVPAGLPLSCPEPVGPPPGVDCIEHITGQGASCDYCRHFSSGDPSDIQGDYPYVYPPSPLDPGGHGTMVASLIGAKGNNSDRIAGTAWTARIMAIRMNNYCNDARVSDFIEAFEYAHENGARVVNYSAGGFTDSLSEREAFRKSEEYGMIVVVAAGNEGYNIDAAGARPWLPASYNFKNQINVAAINQLDQLALFSNWGPNSVHLAAPGVAMRGLPDADPFPPGCDQFQAEWNGTSFSAPIVAGAAALVWAHDPSLTHNEVRERILCSVRQVSGLTGKVSSGGILNVEYALLNWWPACN